jgi:hypothetical protein
MSASFHWEPHNKSPATFRNGTSSDQEALKKLFRGGIARYIDIETLRCMHLATHREESLWGEIADLLERLGPETQIRVWMGY